MFRVGLLSDTHGYFDSRIVELFADCDEIWHAGDFGTAEVSLRLAELRPLRGVYGNVDDARIRHMHPLHQRFDIDGLRVWMTHIGGYPGHYDRRVRDELWDNPPDLFICGHSHILRAERDPRLKLLHLNPGAAGNQGIHLEKTMMRLGIEQGKLRQCQVIELGRRTTTSGPHR